ncbi:MAG: AbrB/MazE/SpoVT family DNA-binding domain-containing protein [Bacteroidota bacterium]
MPLAGTFQAFKEKNFSYNKVITFYVPLNMAVKTLTNVGNSKAVILPKRLIEKYKLDHIILKETEKGILIVPAQDSFQEKLEALRQQRSKVYERMTAQASDPEAIAYYQSEEALGDVDVDIIDP